MLQEHQRQLPPPPQSISNMYAVYEFCSVPHQQRGELIAALYKAGRVKAGAEYQAFQLVLRAAVAQPEVCHPVAFLAWHAVIGHVIQAAWRWADNTWNLIWCDSPL
jgi:hypothetical protein